MKIYTKAGDEGYTRLGTGQAVPKGDLKLEAYGTVDELSSFLGLARSFLPQGELSQRLLWVQSKLFVIGSILAFPGRTSGEGLGEVTGQDVADLEREIDALGAKLPPLTDFVLPGGVQGAALLHCARSICRRAERLVSRLDPEEYPLGREILPFLNRLSDFLFCAARAVNFEAGLGDQLAKLKEVSKVQ